MLITGSIAGSPTHTLQTQVRLWGFPGTPGPVSHETEAPLPRPHTAPCPSTKKPALLTSFNRR